MKADARNTDEKRLSKKDADDPENIRTDGSNMCQERKYFKI